MVDCPDNGPYPWELLQRPEGCLDAFLDALVQDPYVRLVTELGPRSISNLRGSVESALDKAGVILTMRR